MNTLAIALAAVTFPTVGLAQSTFTNLFRSGDVLAPGRTVRSPQSIVGNTTGAGYAVALWMEDGSGEIWFDYVDDGTTSPQLGWQVPAPVATGVGVGSLQASQGRLAWANSYQAVAGLHYDVLLDGTVIAALGDAGPIPGSTWIERLVPIALSPSGEVFLSGKLDVPTGPDRTVVASATTGQILLATGDTIMGAPGTVTSFGLGGMSPDGSHLVAAVNMSNGSSWLALDGEVLTLGATPLRLGATIPAGYGPASGKVMHQFWSADVGNDGQWILDLGYQSDLFDVIIRNGQYVSVAAAPWPFPVLMGERGYALVPDGYSLQGDELLLASDDSQVDIDGDGMPDLDWTIIEPIKDPAGSGFTNPSFCTATINGDGVIYLETRLTSPSFDGRTVGRLGSGLRGSGYCVSEPNSTGLRGRATLVGSEAASDDQVSLVVHQLPTLVVGLGICSMAQGFVPQPGSSVGTLCLGGSVGRLMSGLFSTGARGSAEITLPLSAMPQPNATVQVVAGQRWNFQAWHRDTEAGQATSNFTDAVTIQFL